MNNSPEILCDASRPAYPDSGRDKVLEWAPREARLVLDVGCNMGRFGQLLKERQECQVWGVEPDFVSAEVAVTRLDRVVVGLFEPTLQLPECAFDLITFNDSLEHMPDPIAALSYARFLLKPGGTLLCTVPNVRHIDTVEQLTLEGDWRYETFGVRDKTHLRFFTMKSIQRTIFEAGFIVQRTRFIAEAWWDKNKLWRRVAFRLAPRLTNEFRYLQIMAMATRPVK